MFIVEKIPIASPRIAFQTYRTLFFRYAQTAGYVCILCYRNVL